MGITYLWDTNTVIYFLQKQFPDAIVAATALIHNFTLITRNTKDFKNIDAFQMVNPFEL